MATLSESLEFARAILDDNPNVEIEDIIKLQKLAKSAGRYNLLHCNVGLTDAQQKMADNVREKAKAIVDKFGEGFSLVTNGDPRGRALKVVLPSGRTNSWSGEGWGIPE